MNDIFALTTTVDSNRTSEELRLFSMRTALNEIARYNPTNDQDPGEVITHLKDLAGKALLEDTVESISPSLPSTETEVRFGPEWGTFFQNAETNRNRNPQPLLSYKSAAACNPALSGYKTSYAMEVPPPVNPPEGKVRIIFEETEPDTQQ